MPLACETPVEGWLEPALPEALEIPVSAPDKEPADEASVLELGTFADVPAVPELVEAALLSDVRPGF